MSMKEIEKATIAMKMRMEGKSDLEILIFLHKDEEEDE